ncbi:hypothetical protein [Streptomyces sp. NPDC054804]
MTSVPRLVLLSAGRADLVVYTVGGISPCSCPCPALIRDGIAAHRRILLDCLRHIKRERESGLC